MIKILFKLQIKPEITANDIVLYFKETTFRKKMERKFTEKAKWS